MFLNTYSNLFCGLSRISSSPSLLFGRHGIKCLSHNTFYASRLNKRGLIAVSGADAALFLQGLITNDIPSMSTQSQKMSCPSLYSLMLNVQGRVTNDFSIFHVKDVKPFQPNTYLLDTDLSLIDQTISIFQKYRLRRKVEITNVSEQYQQYSLWNFASRILGTQPLDFFSQKATFIVPDPRCAALGQRLVAPIECVNGSLQQVADVLGENIEIFQNDKKWANHRYAYGIPEGAAELPPGKCLPFESNCDFMNGISFDKGCYIGQELTARTHNIGVTRKRILPIKIEGQISDIKAGDKLFVESGKDLKLAGEVRIVSGQFGLALVRIQYLSVPSLSVKLFVTPKKSSEKAEKTITAGAYAFWPDWFPPLQPVLNKIL